LKRKDAKIKEAQGEMSIAQGNRNRARVVSVLMEKPLTFSELKAAVKLSSPVLTKHLKVLSKEGLIQKALARDNRVVYQVISEKKAVSFIGTLFAGLFLYIVGRNLSAETMDSIRRDLEKMISKEDSETWEKELEKESEKEVPQAIDLLEEEDKGTDESKH
jgi:DNA-binding transcriptional ArsR family regulator